MILSKIAALYIVAFARAIELTFELSDSANQCFFEDIKAGIDCVIEYQVVTGGQYDVDMTLQDERGKILYKGVKKQYDNFSWKTETEGTYKACFSNEFSTFSHKVVYMDWQKETRVSSYQYSSGDTLSQGIDKVTSRIAAVTQLETSASAIGDRLRLIDDYQTHHRLREATGRKRAEDLNERVLMWSLGQTAIIITLGIAQVLLLRSFFTEKRTIF
ncbi:integral type I protein, variant [Loa loa]|uniref:Integral type I protein, variant n=1 Tax=Loa loa TaxID=7209 RepID=A0A1S0ULX8_LOALO|nr:integral type I protein, variant [Loa loa]EJD76358.1 integral type I protein, variant [Loa loa]